MVDEQAVRMEVNMPKVKTNRSAAKRFSVTGTGRLRRHRAAKSHLLVHKNAKRRRRLRTETGVAPADRKRVTRLLPYL